MGKHVVVRLYRIKEWDRRVYQQASHSFLKPVSHVRFIFAVELLLIHSDTGGFAEFAPNIKRIA